MKENLGIIYEDNHVIVVIKPQNIPTQEDESGDLDLLSMIKQYIKEKYNKPGNVYVGLVHRLDRPTGGVMVFAKTSKAASRLCKEIQDGTMKKEYLTVLEGQLPLKTKHLVNYLKKDEERNIVKVAPMSEKGAKRAELVYDIIEVEKEFKDVNLAPSSKINENSLEEKAPSQARELSKILTLAKVELLTGRGHQIRVQFANLKAPVFGDVKYGNGNGKTNELALWAYKLEFVHPTTKEKMSFKVLPPSEKEPWNKFNLNRI